MELGRDSDTGGQVFDIPTSINYKFTFEFMFLLRIKCHLMFEVM